MKNIVFSREQTDLLREKVRNTLSEKRYLHTLGVEKMAIHIGERIMPERVTELRVAALLHDISKEYSEAEYKNIFNSIGIMLTEDDLNTPALWHSITGPNVVGDRFKEYATPDVLSAIYNHTVGSPDMSVFDEIIFIADYVEEGRSYKNCINTRNMFLSELDSAENVDDMIDALHRACATSLQNNINEFVSRGISFHTRTKSTLDALLAKIER